MIIFAKRLKDLRTEKNITLDELAEGTGYSKATLSRYENNIREPKAETAAAIAVYLGVSADYLLGKTDERNKENRIGIDANIPLSYISIAQKAYKSGISPDALAKALEMLTSLAATSQFANI